MRDDFLAFASKFRELRALRDEEIRWRLGREKQNVFVCFPTVSQSYWLFIGTIDEMLALSVTQLNEHIRTLERVRPMIWFPSKEWHNDIGEAEIEAYYGRDDKRDKE